MQSLWLGYMTVLDGARPSGALGWVSPVAPVVTQAVVGAGHWAAGRRQRALAAWAGAAGYGLVAWGLGTEAPTPAEALQNIQRLQKDLPRRSGAKAPATDATQTPTVRHLSRRAPQYGLAATVVGMVLGVRSGLRHPAAADGARDRQPSLGRRVLRPAGGPGRAAARAEDRRGLSPDRRRIGSPAAGSIG
jgi:hypothetical protein